MKEKHRRYTTRAVAALGILVVGFLGLRALRRSVLPLPLDRCHESAFDTAAWRDSTRAYSAAAVRGCMVDDLIGKHHLEGRSRAEIVALLGEPRPTAYFKDFDLVYWVGPERGLMSIDSEWLVIRLDSTGRAKEVRLATD